MSSQPQISLEQWNALIAVVEAGGYAQAAERLFKSQSAVTYAVQKIESQLGVKAFELQGRKAVLTPTGHMLYRRALSLVGDAADLEKAARTLSAGWEAEVCLAVDILFPSWLLFECLARFGQESQRTRIEVIESVLDGTPEAILKGQADLGIGYRVPPGFPGDVLMEMTLVPVARPDHPLHQLGRDLSYDDLRAYRHMTVRDTGTNRNRKALSVEVDQRWTWSHLATAIEAVLAGHGFAWLPRERIRDELASGALKPLPLPGQERRVPLYLMLADPDFAGPGVRRLADIIRESTRATCREFEGKD